MRFFDCYLKGLDNGWKDTPRVRYSILNPGGSDMVDLPETVFPPKAVKDREFFLTETGTLRTCAGPAGETSYDGGDEAAAAEFRLTFSKATNLVGYPLVKLYMRGEDCRDMDVFVEIRKEDAQGRTVAWECTPPNRYLGPIASFGGRLRASMRALDQELSTQAVPVHSFRQPEELEPGQTVCLEIPIRPVGLRFEARETLVLRIGNESTEILNQGRRLGEANRGGRHIICCGGGAASSLRLPIAETDGE